MPITDLARRMIAVSGRPEIGVTFTKLRAGEVMHAFSFYDHENFRPASPGLRMGTAEVPEGTTAADIDELGDWARDSNEARTLELLTRLVPGFER